MSRKGSTGEIRVDFVSAIANIHAPTVAELAAGIPLTPQMRRNGLDTPRSGATIDVSDASTRKDKSAAGNIAQGTVTFRGWRDSVTADDDAYAALPADATGHIVVRRFGGSAAAYVAAQKVEVYKGSILSREMQPIGDDGQNFVAILACEDDDEAATVAA